jgi:hypothetical protein
MIMIMIMNMNMMVMMMMIIMLMVMVMMMMMLMMMMIVMSRTTRLHMMYSIVVSTCAASHIPRVLAMFSSLQPA